MNWIFKYNGVPTETEIKISFEQKNIFRGKRGDNVLLLSKDFMITSSFVLGGIEAIPKDSDDGYSISLFLKERTLFSDEKPLEDYLYSIKRVTNFQYYKRHFSRKYSNITNLEYEAIVNDKIYYERTYLGVIFNSMHAHHQKAFITYLAKKEPSLLAGDPNCEKAFEILKEYLDHAILIQAEYLSDSYDILEDIVPSSILDTISLSNVDDKRQGFIQQQKFVIDEELESFRIALNEIKRWESSPPRFRSYFRNSPLPINIL